MDLALQHHAQGRLPEAEGIYQQILQADPNHPAALHLLGVITHQMGNHDTAVDLIARAIAIKPDYAEAHGNLGNVFKTLGRLDEAVDLYRKALAINPDFADAYNNLGAALKDMGKLDEAIASYRNAIAINPDDAGAHFNSGIVFQDLGNPDEAVASYRKSIAIRPDDAVAHNNLGAALLTLGTLDEAVVSYRNAIAIRPDFAGAHNNLGAALQELGKLDEAMASFHKALAINPNFAKAHNNLGVALQNLGRLNEAEASFNKALAIEPDFSGAGRNLLCAMLNVPGLSPKDLFAEHLRFSERHSKGVARPTEDFTNDPDPDRRLRVGYLSSDFQNHPVGKNVFPLLSCHDRAKFEIFCFADVPRPDAMTERFRSCVDHWRPIAGKPDSEVAAMVRADAIDVLVCLAGRFDKNRPLVCAHRAAPVQVSFHDGATSGLEEMDYWLTDGFLHPADTKERFTEALHRLAVFYQYPPIEEAPTVAALPAEQAGFVTFVSFNNPAKINEEVIRLWAEVLKSVPGSRVLLKYKNLYAQPALRDHVVEGFAARGIERDRVRFAVLDDTLAEHLKHYGEADIALDPFPFNGATTTFQALWMGVPVVSLAGETFISRAGGSILHHAGLGDLAVETPEAYVASARDLAEDLARLRTLRANLRERMATSPLCDAPAYARSVESAYRDMWRTWCIDHKNTPSVDKPE